MISKSFLIQQSFLNGTAVNLTLQSLLGSLPYVHLSICLNWLQRWPFYVLFLYYFSFLSGLHPMLKCVLVFKMALLYKMDFLHLYSTLQYLHVYNIKWKNYKKNGLNCFYKLLWFIWLNSFARKETNTERKLVKNKIFKYIKYIDCRTLIQVLKNTKQRTTCCLKSMWSHSKYGNTGSSILRVWTNICF